MDRYYAQYGRGGGGSSAGCPCPHCVPTSIGYAGSPYGGQTRSFPPGGMPPEFYTDPYSFANYMQQSSGRNAPSRTQTYPMDRDANLREQLRNEVAEHERLLGLEETRLREEQERRQHEEEAELLAELEQAERDQEEMEAQIAEMQSEEEAEKRESHKGRGKRFLDRVKIHFNGSPEWHAEQQRIWEEFQALKHTGGYLSDGRYIVPENKYHTAYAMKPGDRPPANIRADVRTRNMMRMFGMTPAT